MVNPRMSDVNNGNNEETCTGCELLCQSLSGVQIHIKLITDVEQNLAIYHTKIDNVVETCYLPY